MNRIRFTVVLAIVALAGCHEDGGSKSPSWGDLVNAKSINKGKTTAPKPATLAPARAVQPLKLTPTKGPSVLKPLQLKPSRGPSPLQPLVRTPATVGPRKTSANLTARTASKPPAQQSSSDGSWWHTWFRKQPHQ